MKPRTIAFALAAASFGDQLETKHSVAKVSAAQELRAQGRKPYVSPGGGSNALGSLGYVDCVLELQRQCDAMGLRRPHLVHATGSAGTQAAGLVAGIHALGLDWPVTGIVALGRRANCG